MAKNMRIVANSVAVTEAPTEINILPLGYVKSQKGNFIVDDKDFIGINKQFEERKVDLVIDYEHQTLNDVQAPAGGWIKELLLKNDGIYARVEWTEKAKQYIKNKEYRYLSPVVRVSTVDNHVKILHSVALTNTPAIDGMKAIVNSVKGEKNMNDIGRLAILLGLPENAEIEQIVKAIQDLISTVKALKNNSGTEDDLSLIEFVSTLVRKAGLTERNTISDLINTLQNNSDSENKEITALKWSQPSRQAESDKIVQLALSIGQIDERQVGWALKRCKEDLEGFSFYVNSAYNEECSKVVDLALSTGKIAPYQRQWAEKLAYKDLTAFKEFTECAIPVVPMGELITTPLKAEKTISRAGTKISELLGITDEQIKKYNK